METAESLTILYIFTLQKLYKSVNSSFSDKLCVALENSLLAEILEHNLKY